MDAVKILNQKKRILVNQIVGEMQKEENALTSVLTYVQEHYGHLDYWADLAWDAEVKLEKLSL